MKIYRLLGSPPRHWSKGVSKHRCKTSCGDDLVITTVRIVISQYRKKGDTGKRSLDLRRQKCNRLRGEPEVNRVRLRIPFGEILVLGLPLMRQKIPGTEHHLQVVSLIGGVGQGVANEWPGGIAAKANGPTRLVGLKQSGPLRHTGAGESVDRGRIGAVDKRVKMQIRQHQKLLGCFVGENTVGDNTNRPPRKPAQGDECRPQVGSMSHRRTPQKFRIKRCAAKLVNFATN